MRSIIVGKALTIKLLAHLHRKDPDAMSVNRRMVAERISALPSMSLT